MSNAETRKGRKPKYRAGQRVWVRLPATIVDKGKFTWIVAVAGHELNVYPDEVVGRRLRDEQP